MRDLFSRYVNNHIISTLIQKNPCPVYVACFLCDHILDRGRVTTAYSLQINKSLPEIFVFKLLLEQLRLKSVIHKHLVLKLTP